MTTAAYAVFDSLFFGSGFVEFLVRGPVFGLFMGIAFALLPPASANPSSARRRQEIVAYVAVVAALGIIFAVAVVDLEANHHAADYCVVSPPPQARDFPSSRVEHSVVPGRWTCVYRDRGGRELRHTMPLDVFP